MKIGLMTVYYSNYGSYFQTLSLKKKFEDMGHQCDVINATIRGICIYKYVIGVLGEKILPQRFQNVIANKNSAFRIYKSLAKDIKNLDVTKIFQTKKTISKKYDCIVVGSDELWSVSNPEIKFIPAYFGDGITTNIFSYATSGIGMGNLSEFQKEKIIKGLTKFKNISVRDKVTYDRIMQFKNENPKIPSCQQCIDPTLLNPCFIKKAEKVEDYILVYGIDFDDKQKKQIIEFAKRKNLKIKGIAWKHDFFDEFVVAESANDFEMYFAKSRYCATSTFHGTVFSILNHKPFFAFPSIQRIGKVSDLLTTLNLSDRLCMNDISLSDFPAINYDEVENQLSKLRQNSNDYLNRVFHILEGKND